MNKLIITISILLAFSACSIAHNELRFLSDQFNQFTLTSGDELPAIRCFWMDLNTYSLYDLNKLKRTFDAKEDNKITEDGWTVYFSFCDNLIEKCNGQLAQWGAFKDKDCHNLAGPINLGNRWSLLDDNNPDKGVRIFMNSGDPCGNGNKNYTMTLDMVCNPDIVDKAVIKGDINPTACDNKLNFETSLACPNKDIYAVLKFIKDHYSFIGIILIVVGLFLTFLGNKLVTLTIFLITTIVSITLLFVFLFGFIIPGGANPGIVWVVLGIALISGIVLGYLVTKYKKTLIGFTLGAYLGYLVGILLYNALLVRLASHLHVSISINL
jgi:hypothetical protein